MVSSFSFLLTKPLVHPANQFIRELFFFLFLVHSYRLRLDTVDTIFLPHILLCRGGFYLLVPFFLHIYFVLVDDAHDRLPFFFSLSLLAGDSMNSFP